MKRFVVNYVDWFDNVLKSHIVEAEDELRAITKVAAEQYSFDLANKDFSDVNDFQDFCFDCDCMMNVIEV